MHLVAVDDAFNTYLLIGYETVANFYWMVCLEAEIRHRKEREGHRLRHAFGGNGSFGMEEIADILQSERDHCYAALDAFQELVEKQIATNVVVEAGGNPTSGGRAVVPTDPGTR